MQSETEVSTFVGLSKDFTTERTEITEKTFFKKLCALRALGGEKFLAHPFRHSQ